jgi:hypothetical protein
LPTSCQLSRLCSASPLSSEVNDANNQYEGHGRIMGFELVTLSAVKTTPCVLQRVTYIEGDIAMPTIHLTNGETSISGHGSMDHTVRQQCAIDIIRCVARDGTYHVRRICNRRTSSEICYCETSNSVEPKT